MTLETVNFTSYHLERKTLNTQGYIEGDYMGHVNMDYFNFKIGLYKYVMYLSLYFTSLSEYRYQRILLLRVPQDLLFLG